MVLRTCLLFSVSCGISAAATAAPKPAAKLLVWVSHTFIGGPRCTPSGPVQNFEPPGFAAERAKLLRNGVTPEREYFRDYATCEACRKCANYRREILFEIPLEQLGQSVSQGYRKITPPTYEELKAYEEGKRFRVKPDVGGPQVD